MFHTVCVHSLCAGVIQNVFKHFTVSFAVWFVAQCGRCQCHLRALFFMSCLSSIHLKIDFKIERLSEIISFSVFSEPGSTELTGLFVEKPPENMVAVAGQKCKQMSE